MPKNFILTLGLALGLLLLTSACQSLPGSNLFSSDGAESQDAPHSNFVDAREILQVDHDQPVAIETYHISRTGVQTVTITINDQPAAGEVAPFPKDRATAQVLERGQPAQPEFQTLTFPGRACQTLLQLGGPAQRYTIKVEYPISALTLCHIWRASMPGTYELSVAATDTAGRPGASVHQWIEVR